jgi:hypothetical protein
MGAEYVGVLDHEWTVEEVLMLPRTLAALTFNSDLSRLGSCDLNSQWTLSAWDNPPPPVEEAAVWHVGGPVPFSLAVGRRSLQIRFYLKVVPLLVDVNVRAIARQALCQLAELASSQKALLAPDFNGDVIFNLIEAGARLSEVEQFLQKQGSRVDPWDVVYTKDRLTHPFVPSYFVDHRVSKPRP